MSIIRTRLVFEDSYTQIPNSWMRDTRLSRKARGLLAELMTHREGWEVTIDGLSDAGPEGKDAIRSGIKELEDHGYLTRRRARSDGGTFGGIDYELSDPFADNPTEPTPTPPTPKQPTTGNPPLRRPSLKKTTSKEDVAPPASEQPAPPVEFAPEVRDLCDKLANWVHKNTGKKPTVTQQWRLACRRMIELDGIEPKLIAGAIDWCQQDDFWAANIMSMTKLREKYPTLLLQAQRKKGGRPTTAAVVSQTQEQMARFRAMDEAGQGQLQIEARA